MEAAERNAASPAALNENLQSLNWRAMAGSRTEARYPAHVDPRLLDPHGCGPSFWRKPHDDGFASGSLIAADSHAGQDQQEKCAQKSLDPGHRKGGASREKEAPGPSPTWSRRDHTGCRRDLDEDGADCHRAGENPDLGGVQPQLGLNKWSERPDGHIIQEIDGVGDPENRNDSPLIRNGPFRGS